MENTPNKIYAGMLLGIIGGTIAILGLALSFTPDTGTIMDMGLCMLCAVAFYGTAGGFRADGPWKANLLIAMCFISIAVAICTVLAGSIALWIGVVLVLIGVVMLLCAACPKSKSWLNAYRA